MDGAIRRYARIGFVAGLCRHRTWTGHGRVDVRKEHLRAAFSYKWGIDGLSGVPSIFEYVGSATDRPAAGQSLQLLSAEQREHGVMWLRYKFHKKRHK